MAFLSAFSIRGTDSTRVVAAVRELNRTEGIAETLRAALNALATVAPTWLRQHLNSEWFERYAHGVEEYRLPKGVEARIAYMEVVGNDGIELLHSIYDEANKTPLGVTLRQLEAVEILRQIGTGRKAKTTAINRWYMLDFPGLIVPDVKAVLYVPVRLVNSGL